MAQTSNLIGTIMQECPICDTFGPVQHRVRTSKLTSNDIAMEFDEQYFHCPKCDSNYIPAKTMDENLARVRALYSSQQTDITCKNQKG